MGGMYLFERKARFYERRYDCKADCLIVISPMVDKRAKKLAKRLSIDVYSDSLGGQKKSDDLVQQHRNSDNIGIIFSANEREST